MRTPAKTEPLVTTNGFLVLLLVVELVAAIHIGKNVRLQREPEERLLLQWYQKPSEDVRLEYLREQRLSRIYGWLLVGASYAAVATLTVAVLRRARRKRSDTSDGID